MEDELESLAKRRVGRLIKEKYRVDSLIGIGGVAAVYAATHRNGLRVAIKVLHAEHSNNAGIKTRFLREGYLANRVEHPGVVRVTDDDVDVDGCAYLVMELLTGATVEDLHAAGRVDLGLALGVADATLDVLAAAHEVSVVHRDIKPANLFLTRGGPLKVLDFGVARLGNSRITNSGEIWGTAAFMAPEQARGETTIDHRADVWALGAVLFALLTGRDVHEGKNDMVKLVQTATQQAPSVASIAPGVPPPLVEIVDRSLAFERDARYADARQMQTALRGAHRYQRLAW